MNRVIGVSNPQNDNKNITDLWLALAKTTLLNVNHFQKEAEETEGKHSRKPDKLTKDGDLHHHTIRPLNPAMKRGCDLQQNLLYASRKRRGVTNFWQI